MPPPKVGAPPKLDVFGSTLADILIGRGFERALGIFPAADRQLWARARRFGPQRPGPTPGTTPARGVVVGRPRPPELERPDELVPTLPGASVPTFADPRYHCSRDHMNAIKVATTIDERLVEAVPELRPLLGQRVELTARQQEGAARPATGLTVDEFFAARLARPAGVGPVSLVDMERAIAESASGHGEL